MLRIIENFDIFWELEILMRKLNNCSQNAAAISLLKTTFNLIEIRVIIVFFFWKLQCFMFAFWVTVLVVVEEIKGSGKCRIQWISKLFFFLSWNKRQSFQSLTPACCLVQVLYFYCTYLCLCFNCLFSNSVSTLKLLSFFWSASFVYNKPPLVCYKTEIFITVQMSIFCFPLNLDPRILHL